MNNKRRFYKTVVTVEVLHEDSIAFGSLEELGLLISTGDYSGRYTVHESEPLTPIQMAEAAVSQGSDPEFFGIDENGKDIL